MIAPCHDGTYPNYQQVIPAKATDGVSVIDFSGIPPGVLQESLAQFTGTEDDMVVLYGDPERVVLVGSPPEEGKPRLTIPLVGAVCSCEHWIAVGVNRGFFEEPVRQGFNQQEEIHDGYHRHGKLQQEDPDGG